MMGLSVDFDGEQEGNRGVGALARGFIRISHGMSRLGARSGASKI